MEHSYTENGACNIRLQLSKSCKNKDSNETSLRNSQCVENVENLDVFIDSNHFLIYADVKLFKCYSKRAFDLDKIDDLTIKYDSQGKFYEVQLPCLPINQTTEDKDDSKTEKNNRHAAKTTAKCPNNENVLDLWKLKRLTEHCWLELDLNAKEKVRLESNFTYGFASKYNGKVCAGECDVTSVSRMPVPQFSSPLQRTIDREIDEMKDFSRDQYKVHFVELQVEEGHDNPMKYIFKYENADLTKDEECLLHNLTRNPEDLVMPVIFNQMEVDCGLVSILLAICYDVRCTHNEPNCESGWTRSILSAVIMYFEPFNSMKEVIISFLRRCLTYPLYRNYDLGSLCIEDAIYALHKAGPWVLKQLLVTHKLFLSADTANREVFNRYYIEDYIRYVHLILSSSNGHLYIVAHNLRNVLYDVSKKHLRLGLGEIETELVKELITDFKIHPHDTSSDEEIDVSYEDDAEDYDDCSESGEDENDEGDVDVDDESTTSSETEEDSVIEQHLNIMDLSNTS